jgi:hypothetical protein
MDKFTAPWYHFYYQFFRLRLVFDCSPELADIGTDHVERVVVHGQHKPVPGHFHSKQYRAIVCRERPADDAVFLNNAWRLPACF